MSNERVGLLRQRVDSWNEWRRKNPAVISPDLRAAELHGANLAGANLHGANFRRADLSGASLVGADLGGASLVEATVVGANLTDADLTNANLKAANLRRSDFHGADFWRANLNEVNLNSAYLIDADFNDTDLRAADFTETQVMTTTFANVDLSQVVGLDSIRHLGPSTIGIDTIYRSKGKIPEVFLRGAGVPETFIIFAKSLVNVTVEFYSCFISYSSQDQAFAERLHADLIAKNMRVWFAPEDLKIGDRFPERIEESIRLFDKVMIVLSEASVRSRWVEREMNAAREREDRENRTVLFPLRIDDAIMDAPQHLAADVRRSRHIGDFSKWKDNDSYHKALARLLRDLRAEGKAQA